MIYLDNAATSFPKPEAVYQALDRFARQSLANPGRAGHKMALAAEHALDDGRHLLNQLFHGKEPERFVFTLNCTDALNMAFKGVLNEGDHVITTDLEHNSVSRPLRAMELAGRITLTRLAADGGGTIDPDDVRQAITPKTRLIALTHASNVLGTVQPIAEVGRIAREHDLLFLVDAAQTAGVVPIDVQAMNIDLLAVPGPQVAARADRARASLYVGPRATVAAVARGRHRRRFVQRDAAARVSLLPRRRHAQRPRRRRPGRGHPVTCRSRGWTRIHEHEVALVERLWRRLGRDRRLRGVRPSRSRAGASAR